jgi:hypothetical protein
LCICRLKIDEEEWQEIVKNYISFSSLEELRISIELVEHVWRVEMKKFFPQLKKVEIFDDGSRGLSLEYWLEKFRKLNS